jgi:exopolysaccharide biosynthesis polyprenyl glycosylphosphotransferase
VNPALRVYTCGFLWSGVKVLVVMRLHNIKDKLALILAGDFVAILAAFTIALALGHMNPLPLNLFWYSKLFWHYKWGILVLVFSIMIIFVILNVYSLNRMAARFLRQMLFVGYGLLFSSVFVTFIFFFFRDIAIPRAVFIFFFPWVWILIVFSRYLYNKLFLSLIFWKVLIIGDKNTSKEMAELINRRKYLHSQVVGYLSGDADADSSSDLPFLGRLENLLAVAEAEDIDQVIVTYKKINDELMKTLLDCMRKKIEVTDFKKVTGEIMGKVPIEYLDDNWFILELNAVDKRYSWYVKKFIDIILSLICLYVSMPFLPVIALLIRMDSKGPVFYSQMRVGRDGKHFRVWKLRTKVADADRGNVYWTVEKDSRITRIGRFLRKLRLDEIPQLVNIIKGDMSFVGPRPEAVSLSEMYAREIPYYTERYMVTPGVTGWAQINYHYGNSVDDAREKLKYDFYYIKNRNLTLDMLIFLRTIRSVLTGKGAI